jgi:acetoin:2,6-dichlorophenolindophenol oxidoreductase subunit alpha
MKTEIDTDLTSDRYIELYRRMVRIRYFEETAAALHLKGDISGVLHSSVGQEAEIVGACMAVRIDDYMVGNHRSHGHPIGKGANVNSLMAELMGRKTGVCGGKGGSMHLSDFSVGSLGESSIVGSGLPVATGAALGSKMMGLDRVALCFFGDGASNEGTFHESLNLAAIWRLPAIYLCENNLYALSTPTRASVSVEHIAQRAQAYGLPGEIVDGQDVLAVYAAVSRAAARARVGDGATLIEAKTYRFEDHAMNMGRDFTPRMKDELKFWKDRDPISLFREKLVEKFQFAAHDLKTVETEVREEIDVAVKFSADSSFPDLSEAFTQVYTNPFPLPANGF